MLRLIFIVLAVALLSQFETLNLGCLVSAQTGCKPCYRPDPDPNKKVENKAPDVVDITLSTDELTLPCNPGGLPSPGYTVSASTIVDVVVAAADPENDVLAHNYMVSGGRIVGTGSHVRWDLSKVSPGTYTITAGVDDGCGTCGKTQAKTITVKRSCIEDCQCATVEISGPVGEVLKAHENMFTANVTAGTYDPVYEWSVDGGEIASGQGSPSISVEFDQKTLKSKKTITLRIGGAPSSCSCISDHVVEYIDGRRKP